MVRMHTRRLASWLLGAWIAGSLAMFLVATHNFQAVDHLLAAPATPATGMIQKLGAAPARMLLRYLSSELNRWYFPVWEWAQIVLLLGLTAAAAQSGRAARLIPPLLLLLTLLERFAITPEVIRLGRMIDFVPPEASSLERSQFWKLHGAYSALEVVKLLLGIVLSVLLLRRSRQFHVVDEADYGHVDR
jgi:hypothetical protein